MVVTDDDERMGDLAVVDWLAVIQLVDVSIATRQELEKYYSQGLVDLGKEEMTFIIFLIMLLHFPMVVVGRRGCDCDWNLYRQQRRIHERVLN